MPKKHSAAELEMLGVTGKRRTTASQISTEEKQLRAFRKQLAVMPDEYVRCHNFGHSTYEATVNPDEEFVIGQVCYSCAMEIDRYRHPLDGRWVSRYWHPKGHEYYFHGTGRITLAMKVEIHEEWKKRTGNRLPNRPVE